MPTTTTTASAPISKPSNPQCPPHAPLPRIEYHNALPLPTYRQRLFPFSSSYAPGAILPSPPTTPAIILPPTYILTPLQTAATLTPTDFNACLNLIETTSAEAYAASSMGWSKPKKRKEMRLPDLRYLVIKRQRRHNYHCSTGPEKEGQDNWEDAKEHGEEEVAGFMSFMLTYEDGYEVIYCYEIHLSPELRGKGVGRQMMGLLEGMGRRVGVQKAMLTVLLANAEARRFYEGCGYQVDDYSPRPRRLRNGIVKVPDYEILSKGLVGEEEGRRLGHVDKKPRIGG